MMMERTLLGIYSPWLQLQGQSESRAVSETCQEVTAFYKSAFKLSRHLKPHDHLCRKDKEGLVLIISLRRTLTQFANLL